MFGKIYSVLNLPVYILQFAAMFFLISSTVLSHNDFSPTGERQHDDLSVSVSIFADFVHVYKKTVRIIMCMRPANERRRDIITSSLIGCTHTQNDPPPPNPPLKHTHTPIMIHNLQC